MHTATVRYIYFVALKLVDVQRQSNTSRPQTEVIVRFSLNACFVGEIKIEQRVCMTKKNTSVDDEWTVNRFVAPSTKMPQIIMKHSSPKRTQSLYFLSTLPFVRSLERNFTSVRHSIFTMSKVRNGKTVYSH